MAQFFIQTDKDVYFAGDTVNGNIFINVGALIVGAQGISLKFTGYECVKWAESTELHRPAPRTHHGKGPHRKPYDPIAAIPPSQLQKSDVNLCLFRILAFLIVRAKATEIMTIDRVLLELQPIDTIK